MIRYHLLVIPPLLIVSSMLLIPMLLVLSTSIANRVDAIGDAITKTPTVSGVNRAVGITSTLTGFATKKVSITKRVCNTNCTAKINSVGGINSVGNTR